MAKTVSNLAVSFTAKTSKFTKGVNKMKRDLKKIKRQVAGFSKVVIGVSVAGAAASIAALGRIAGNIDDLVKTSEKLGIVPEKLKGLQHAAGLSGVNVKTLNMALQRMTRRLSEASIGTGEAQDALKELGLNAEYLSTLSPDEQFMAIADAMEQIDTQSKRVRLAFKIFDSEGVAIVNTMKGGSEAIRAAQQDMIDLGGTLDEEGTGGVVEMQNQVKRLKALFNNLSEKVTMVVAGPLADMIEKFIEAKTAGGGIGEFVEKGMIKAVAAIAGMLDGLEYLKAGWYSFEAAVSAIGFSIAKIIEGWIGLVNMVRGALGMSSDKSSFAYGAAKAVSAAAKASTYKSLDQASAAASRAGSGEAGKELLAAFDRMMKSTDKNTQETAENTAMFKEMLRVGAMSTRQFVRKDVIPELVAAGR